MSGLKSGLVADNLTVTLNGRRVVDAASLAAPRGVVTGLLGPNGAGKTSVLRGVLGLLPGYGGRVLLDGTDLGALSLPERARRMAYLPQGGVVHWPLLVEALIALGRLPHGGRQTPEDEAVIEAAMRAADVRHLRGRSVSTLSGGERVRVMLARALATDGDVLIADEPVAMLDPLHALQVMETLRRQAESGRVVVVVLHDLALAARYCGHLVLMHQGRVAAAGTASEVLTAHNLGRVYGVRLPASGLPAALEPAT